MFQKQSVSSTLKELENIVAIIRRDNPNVAIFLTKILPTDDPEREKRVAALNAEIHKVVERTKSADSFVALVDHYSDFDVKLETFDGVHPNHAGDVKMVQRWFDALNDYLKNSKIPQ